MQRIKTPGVPLWVTLGSLVIAVLGTAIGLATIANPAIMSITEIAVGQQWGGRNVGVALVLAVAVFARSRVTYLAGLLAGLARDLSDVVAAVTAGAAPTLPLVFVAFGVAALVTLALAGRASDAVSTQRAPA